MATTKKSTRSSSAKKTTKPKPPKAPKASAPVAGEPVAVEEPAVPEAVPAPPAAKHSIETGERAFVRGIQSDDLVRFRVPEDPFGEIKTWERSFNGHIIVLKAGEEYELPLRIVKFIERSLHIQRLSSNATAPYTIQSRGGLGKRI